VENVVLAKDFNCSAIGFFFMFSPLGIVDKLKKINVNVPIVVLETCC
jgi:hypothetical protein